MDEGAGGWFSNDGALGRTRPVFALLAKIRFRSGGNHFLARGKKPGERDVPLWQEARKHLLRGGLGGSHPSSPSGKAFWGNEAIKVNPTFRFGV